MIDNVRHGDKPTPPPPAFPPFRHKIHPISSPPSIPVPHLLHSRCRMDRERFDAGGRECLPVGRANVSVARGRRRWPTRFRWRAALLRDVQSQPPGRGPFPASPAGWITGHGPVADMAGFSRQGPCRNTRPKHLSRSVQAAAGATRAEGPEEGQVDKPTPCVCEASACRMGTPSGEFRAARCQRHPHTNHSTRGTARARPSGLKWPADPGGLAARGGFQLSVWRCGEIVTARRNPAPASRCRAGPGRRA